MIVVEESGIAMRPDPSRVITRFFVPGREEVGPGDSRAGAVIERVLRLDDDAVAVALADLDVRFLDRHRDLHATFERHASNVEGRLDPTTHLSAERRLLLGATFTHEYAIEGAALCNPSAVLHPDQPTNGDTRFVLSVRAIGEGHRSSIGFRTGSLSAAGVVTMDEPGPFPELANTTAGEHHRSVMRAKLAALGDDNENADYVLGELPARFTDAELDARIDALVADAATRRHTSSTAGHLREIARASYGVEFGPATELSERVLWPRSPAEHHGMEDARFVRFIEDTGAVRYYGTYTAFDGANVAQHLLSTEDFVLFTSSPMTGSAATGKGLALFPRRIDGRFAALSRSDRETNSIAFSDDIRLWDDAHLLQAPELPWELVQLGNCGSPIETSAGWIVLTHGVGPMRTYCLGAILLDLDDPRQVIGHLAEPLIAPGKDRCDGYVPNVIYSCGGFAHGDVLVLPYGVGDQRISIATVSVSEMIDAMRTPAGTRTA